jgi:hypothetical protein
MWPIQKSPSNSEECPWRVRQSGLWPQKETTGMPGPSIAASIPSLGHGALILGKVVALCAARRERHNRATCSSDVKMISEGLRGVHALRAALGRTLHSSLRPYLFKPLLGGRISSSFEKSSQVSLESCGIHSVCLSPAYHVCDIGLCPKTLLQGRCLISEFFIIPCLTRARAKFCRNSLQQQTCKNTERDHSNSYV